MGINAHTGLLHHSLAIPKLLYLLRASPCFLSSSLKIYDDELRATVCSSFYIQLAESDPSWTQSTVPVRHGGLGIRSVVQLAPSAVLASAAASSRLAHLMFCQQICNHPSSAMWMRLLLHGPTGVKNNPPLMLLLIIRRPGIQSEYLQLQIHY